MRQLGIGIVSVGILCCLVLLAAPFAIDSEEEDKEYLEFKVGMSIGMVTFLFLVSGGVIIHKGGAAVQVAAHFVGAVLVLTGLASGIISLVTLLGSIEVSSGYYIGICIAFVISGIIALIGDWK